MRFLPPLLFAASLLAACTTTTGRSVENYMSELAPVMRAHHDDLAAHRLTWAGMDDARLAAAYASYEQSLQDFAADLDAISTATNAEDAHDRMGVATRALAIIYGDRAATLSATATAVRGTPEPTPDFDGREERRAKEWFEACHELQDLALTRELEVDLLCATMLDANE